MVLRGSFAFGSLSATTPTTSPATTPSFSTSLYLIWYSLNRNQTRMGFEEPKLVYFSDEDVHFLQALAHTIDYVARGKLI